ncbi:MAG: hypothetical protein ACXV5U_05890 [Ilumatobacteraceae bacterium]
MNTRIQPRLMIAVLGVSLALIATACGSGKNASAQVASLGSTTGTTPDTTSPANTQEALLKYAACMRTNGVNMADPTFDADGNPTGGGFGRNSGVDRSSAAFQAAQKVCGNLLQGVRLGGGGRNFDPTAIQNSLNDFTACLRTEGLQVDDITFARPGGAGNGGTGGGPPADGSVPPGGGGFGGPPPNGSGPANGGQGGPGRGGFDPTKRLIQQLKLDDTDPKVIAALAKCQPILTAAFTPTTTTTTP